MAGGSYTHMDGIRCGCLAQWDGETWLPMGSGLLPPDPLRDPERTGGAVPSIPEGNFALEVYRGHLFVAGNFYSVGGEPSRNIAEWGEGPLDTLPGQVIDIVRAAPNPFREEVTLLYRLEEPAAASLTIFDVSGRRVAHLDAGVQDPGPHALTWDGANALGARAPAGVYYGLLRAGPGRRLETVVLLR